MEKILTNKEAENNFYKLTDRDKHIANSDKIRFGEYYIGLDQNSYYRINPLNVIISEGGPVNINPDDITII